MATAKTPARKPRAAAAPRKAPAPKAAAPKAPAKTPAASAPKAAPKAPAKAPKAPAPKAAAPKAPAKAAPRAKASPATAPKPQPRAASRALGIFSIGAALVAAGAAVFEAVRRLRPGAREGHVPTDLMRDTHPGPGDRAIPAFRPDPTAPVSASEREALRPATLPPTRAA